MTLERKKAILVLAATLIVGILIGALSTGMMARHHYRGPQKQYRNHSGNRNAFVDKIFRITGADSAQAKQMKPVIEQTMIQIDSLENHSRQEAKVLMDSMNASFQSILKPEQMEKLNEFTAKMVHARHRVRH